MAGHSATPASDHPPQAALRRGTPDWALTTSEELFPPAVGSGLIPANVGDGDYALHVDYFRIDDDPPAIGSY